MPFKSPVDLDSYVTISDWKLTKRTCQLRSTRSFSFLQKYVPDDVDATELIEMAINAAGEFDWGAIFTPDLIDDCDGFDKDYFGEEEADEVEKTEEELAAG